MRAGDFFAQFGFSADPLESTNAENEPRLADYFVPPPYFVEVLGDPLNPHPDVVFAPRGSGKTAQRRMVRTRAQQDSFFASPTTLPSSLQVSHSTRRHGLTT